MMNEIMQECVFLLLVYCSLNGHVRSVYILCSDCYICLCNSCVFSFISSVCITNYLHFPFYLLNINTNKITTGWVKITLLKKLQYKQTWFRTVTSGRQLWTWFWTSGFHKMCKTSWLVKELLAFQEGICCMVLNSVIGLPETVLA
jgi:hypothetical protein